MNEVLSTEEILAKIERANHVLKERMVMKGVLSSMDVEALYLSIDQETSARIIVNRC